MPPLARLLVLLLACSVVVPRAAAIRCCTEAVYLQSGCNSLGGGPFNAGELEEFDDPAQCSVLGDIYELMGGANWIGETYYNYYQRAYDAAATGPGYYVGFFSYIVCNGDLEDLGGPYTQRRTCDVLTSLGQLSGGGPIAGRIPDSIGSLTGLVDFNFPGNPALSGTLPASIGSLTALTSLILNDCALTGTLPTSLGSLTNLKTLQLRGNKFTGTVPDLSGLTALTFLDLSYNGLSGSVPLSITAPPLTALHLEGNALTGPIDFLTQLTVATYVNLYSNQFSGTVPPLTAAVQYLFAHENFLTGGLPDLSATIVPGNAEEDETTTTTDANAWHVHYYGDMTTLRTLDLSKNMLSATVTDAQWDQMGTWIKTHNAQAGNGYHIPWNYVGWSWAPGWAQLPIPAYDAHIYFDISNNALQGTIPRENALRSLVNVLPQRGFNLIMQHTLVADFSDMDRGTDAGIAFSSEHDGGYYNGGNEDTVFGLMHTSLTAYPTTILLRADADNCAETLPADMFVPNEYGEYTPYVPFFPADATLNLAPHGHLHYSTGTRFSGVQPQQGLTGTSLTIIGDCPDKQCVMSAAAVRHFTLFHAGLKLVNVTLRGGRAPEDTRTGAYLNDQYVQVPGWVDGVHSTTTQVRKLQGTYGGGAIFADRWSILELDGCTVEDNVGFPWGALPARMLHSMRARMLQSAGH
jgi:hypothetical protein